jgi:hypothetical protein
MQVFSCQATERGIRERGGPIESPRPTKTWRDIVDEKERDRIEAAERQRADGIRILRINGMPEWALTILIDVADRRNVCPSEIAGRKRDAPIVEARREAAYLIKEKKPELSGPRLGKWFGKDPTCIFHLIACYQAAHSDASKLVGYNIEKRRQSRRRAA